MLKRSVNCFKYGIQKQILSSGMDSMLNLKNKKEVIRKVSLQDKSEPGLVCC